MEAKQYSRRHRCRTVDLKAMFHGIANAVRIKGQNAFAYPIEGGVAYQFTIGDYVCTYSYTKGGAV